MALCSLHDKLIAGDLMVAWMCNAVSCLDARMCRCAMLLRVLKYKVYISNVESGPTLVLSMGRSQSG